jgi:hypothetical protein
MVTNQSCQYKISEIEILKLSEKGKRRDNFETFLTTLYSRASRADFLFVLIRPREKEYL